MTGILQSSLRHSKFGCPSRAKMKIGTNNLNQSFIPIQDTRLSCVFESKSLQEKVRRPRHYLLKRQELGSTVRVSVAWPAGHYLIKHQEWGTGGPATWDTNACTSSCILCHAAGGPH